jgi:hypothetical protein
VVASKSIEGMPTDAQEVAEVLGGGSGLFESILEGGEGFPSALFSIEWFTDLHSGTFPF